MIYKECLTSVWRNKDDRKLASKDNKENHIAGWLIYHCIHANIISFYTNSEDIEEPLPPIIQPASSVEVIKYIVFTWSLMELFTRCTSRCNECIGKFTYHKGTFVAVRQHCSYCGNQLVWRSQPHIKGTQAGNILLSAAILSSGATPGKILQMLPHMWVASISNRTFHYYQSQYLQPAVLCLGNQAAEVTGTV